MTFIIFVALKKWKEIMIDFGAAVIQTGVLYIIHMVIIINEKCVKNIKL